MDDKSLVESARRGDRGAFEALVKRYEAKVYHLAYGFVQDPATADDLAQDVFVKVYCHLSKFKFESEFGTWLYRIAVNHIKDHLRKIDRRREVSLQESPRAGSTAEDPAPGREAERLTEERRAAVHKALQTLPPKYNVILTLRDVRGLSYEEIADDAEDLPGDGRLPAAPGAPPAPEKDGPLLTMEGRGLEGGGK